MFKKLTLVAMSVAALVAFVVPAAAQAEVTDSLGGEAQTLEAHGEGVTTTSSGGATLVCATVNLHLDLTAPTTYEGDGTADGHINENPPHLKKTCTINGTIPVTINSITVNHVKFNGGGTGTAKFSFTFTVGTMLMCNNVGEIGFEYEPTDDTITITEGKNKLTGTENILAGCAAESEIKGSFTVTDEFGEPAVIH